MLPLITFRIASLSSISVMPTIFEFWQFPNLLFITDLFTKYYDIITPFRKAKAANSTNGHLSKSVVGL
jgi:hypothetical protein